MSGPILVRDTAGSLTLFLQTSAGTPATGLAFSDVTIDLKKEAGIFINKTLDALNFTELDGGFYELSLSTADTDTLGNLYVRVVGASLLTSAQSAFVAADVPSNPTGSSPPTLTTIFGWLYNNDGSPAEGKSVTAKVVDSPLLLSNATEGSAIVTSLTVVKTGADGYFQMDLVRGATVDVKIPSASYSRILNVPVQSSNLFDIE